MTHLADREARPFVIGLTGAIGTGKSAVLADLVSFGAEGIDADRVVHEVMAPGGPVHAAIAREFGTEILAPDGQIDRARLGQHVFTDPAKLTRLEAIVHPAVGETIASRVATSTKSPAVVIEAIKLLEAGLSRRLCDEVWVTHCSLRRQIARLQASRGMTEAEVRRRLASQMPPKQMIAQAQRVIDTGGSRAETGIQALSAWAKLGLPFPVVVRPGALTDADGIRTVLNSIVREGGATILDRTYSIAQERAFLRRLPPRARLTLAQVGNVVAGFQIIEPYVWYTRVMDHAATLGSYVIAPLRGRGIGKALSRSTFAAARELGFNKLVIQVRADNPGAQAFYAALGFQPCGRLARQAFAEGGRYVDELLYELFLGDQTA